MIGKIILLTVGVLGFIASAIVVKRTERKSDFSGVGLLFFLAAAFWFIYATTIFIGITVEVLG